MRDFVETVVVSPNLRWLYPAEIIPLPTSPPPTIGVVSRMLRAEACPSPKSFTLKPRSRVLQPDMCGGLADLHTDVYAEPVGMRNHLLVAHSLAPCATL